MIETILISSIIVLLLLIIRSLDRKIIKERDNLIKALVIQNDFLSKKFLELLLKDAIANEDYVTANKCKIELEKLKK